MANVPVKACYGAPLMRLIGGRITDVSLIHLGSAFCLIGDWQGVISQDVSPPISTKNLFIKRFMLWLDLLMGHGMF